MTRMAAIILFLGALPTSSGAEESQKDQLVPIFAVTCMQHLYKKDQLQEFMNSTGAMELEPDQSRSFLNGKPGKAWAIPIQMGNYVVSLTDEGMCSAFARTADVSEIEKSFKGLVSTAPPPLKSVEFLSQPADQKNKRLSYNWIQSEQDSSAINFTLTYSESPESQLRALITAAIITR